MYLSNGILAGLLPLFSTLIHASPLAEDRLIERNLPAVDCAKVTKVISVLKLNQATSFCSSFLGIKTSASTITTVRTSTVTSTTGTASTTITFLPGNPPALKERREEAKLDGAGLERRNNPAYLSGIASSAISSGCECLNLPTPVSKTTKTSVKTTTINVPAPTVTKTVYPTPVPTLIPTVPFGKANQPPSIPGNGQNSLYGAGTKGETIEGCCNLCYFEIPNCINAFFYGYQGCVVQQPSEVIGTGPGISAVCPNGQIAGLTYSRDTAPPFRSQGDIAGPCGQTYNNL
ncbi:MAG: hypothetical protein Q9186_006113 [Xanthomendoza sp. 1 TL-2023]